jgi:hypothetical protein
MEIGIREKLQISGLISGFLLKGIQNFIRQIRDVQSLWDGSLYIIGETESGIMLGGSKKTRASHESGLYTY